MQTLRTARDSADAVARFAAILAGADEAMRIDACWQGADGLSALSAAEAAIEAAWPRAAGKDLVWLTGERATGGKVLRLQARGLDGALMADAVYQVG